MKRWTAGPVEVEYQWERAAVDVAGSVAAAPAGGDTDPEIQRLRTLADTDPAAAIDAAFALVERELRAIAARGGIEGADRLPVGPLADAARETGLITPE